MDNIALQFLGLLALIAAVGGGCWRCVRPHDANRLTVTNSNLGGSAASTIIPDVLHDRAIQQSVSPTSY